MRIKVHTDEGRIKFVYPVDERYIRTVAQLSEAVGRVLGVEANDNDGSDSTSIKDSNLSRKRKNAGRSRAGDSSKSTIVSLSLDGFALLPSHAISAVLRDGDSIEAVVQVNPGNRHAAKKRRMLSHAVTVESSDESSEESEDELSSPISEESSSDSDPDSSSVESDDSDSSSEHVSVIVVDSESETSDDVSVHEEEIPATPEVSDIRMRQKKAPIESTSANDHQVMAPPMSLGRAKRKLIESMARNKETRVHHRFDLSTSEEPGQPEKAKEPIKLDAQHAPVSSVAESKKQDKLKGKTGTASAESQHRLETSQASSSPKQPKQMQKNAASTEAPQKPAQSLPQKSSILEGPTIPVANKKLPPSQNQEVTPKKIQEPAPENSNKKKQPKKQPISLTPKQPTPQKEQLESSSSKQTTITTPSASSNLPPPRGVRTYVELYDDHPDAFTTPNTTPGGASSNGKRKRGLTKKQRAKQELSREQEFDSVKSTRDLNEDIGDLDYGDDGYGCSMSSAANGSASKSQLLIDGYTRVSKGTSDGGRTSGTGFERRSATGDSTKSSTKSTATATLQTPAVKDYTTYPSLKKMPVPGSIIAYKLLHMSENYTPEISSYIESTVVSVNYSDGSLTVQSVVAPVTPVTPVKYNQSQGREGVYYGEEDERWYAGDDDVEEGEYRKFDVGDVGEFVVVDEFNGVGDGLRTLMFADLIEPRVLPS
ncbi:hypothetical protein BJ741DRAFT_591510 [Chytriomyces cf. hyalinus JEL632]|nr:hypothetical protein BJ741DRAFT_591510 [Chytriomyces cf. hyalinus JEL632]